MQTFLIEADHEGDATKIKEAIETRFPYAVDTSFSTRETALLLRTKPVRLMVVSLRLWTEELTLRFLEIRKMYPQLSIVLILDHLNVLDSETAQKNRIYVLPRNVDDKSLSGVIRKMLLLRQIPQQKNERYRTETSSTVEFPLTGDELNSMLFNLSKTGAYMEFQEKPPVSVGDVVRVRVQLDQLNKDHHLPAKVVWFSRRGQTKGGFGVGLQFMPEEDYYRQMLARM